MNCSRCSAEVLKPGYCTPCNADWQRIYGGDYGEKAEERKKKAKARAIAHRAVKNGTLIPQPCEVPGCTNKPEMHHNDYNKPLEVDWLCKPHHGMWHRIQSGKFLKRA